MVVSLDDGLSSFILVEKITRQYVLGTICEGLLLIDRFGWHVVQHACNHKSGAYLQI